MNQTTTTTGGSERDSGAADTRDMSTAAAAPPVTGPAAAAPQALRDELQTLRRELDEARLTINQLERRQKIDNLLRDEETTDLEVARLLTESAVMSMSEPDVRLAVTELRQRKPYLFRRRSVPGAGAMAAHEATDAPAQADEVAEQAAHSGDRRDLLRYLRLRRAPQAPPA